jgi:hypothetical protein
VTQPENCCQRCSLCGPYQGYITRSSCDYERVLNRAVRRVGAAVKQSPASEYANAVADEAMVLEAVTRRQPVKIQQTEKT